MNYTEKWFREISGNLPLRAEVTRFLQQRVAA